MTQVTDHYQTGYHSIRYNPHIKDRRFYHAQASTAAKNYFSRFPKPYSHVLEYGCGIGCNIACLDHAIGYDTSLQALAYCDQAGGTPIYNGYNPTIGLLTHQLLTPLLNTFGHTPYYHTGRFVGRSLGFIEMVIHARRTHPSNNNKSCLN